MDEMETKTVLEAEKSPVVQVSHSDSAPPQRITNRGMSEGSRRTQFRKGNKANPYGRKGKPPKVLSKERHDDLEVMWHVYQNHEPADWTVQQSLFRKWMQMDMIGFLKHFWVLQKRAASKRRL